MGEEIISLLDCVSEDADRLCDRIYDKITKSAEHLCQTAETIEKEYGMDRLFYRLSDIEAGEAKDGKIHISIIDDVLATGGTAEGIALSMQGRKVVKDGVECEIVIDEFIFLVGLDGLSGEERLKKIAPVKTLIHLE